MMPKVVMKMPPGVGGHIQASKSLKNYQINPDGTVVVDACDVSDLHGVGASVVPQKGGPDEVTKPITADSPSSDLVGAHAADPANREHKEPEPDMRELQPAASKDHGGAMPPHSIAPAGQASATQQKRADNEAEAVEQARERSDTAQPEPQRAEEHKEAEQQGVNHQSAG